MFPVTPKQECMLVQCITGAPFFTQMLVKNKLVPLKKGRCHLLEELYPIHPSAKTRNSMLLIHHIVTSNLNFFRLYTVDFI